MIVKDKGYVSYADLINDDRLTKVKVRDSRVLAFKRDMIGSGWGDLVVLLADKGLLFTWSSHGVGNYEVRLDPRDDPYRRDPRPDRCGECDGEELIGYPGCQVTISMCSDNWQQDYTGLWLCPKDLWYEGRKPWHSKHPSPPLTDDDGREFDPYRSDRPMMD